MPPSAVPPEWQSLSGNLITVLRGQPARGDNRGCSGLPGPTPVRASPQQCDDRPLADGKTSYHLARRASPPFHSRGPARAAGEQLIRNYRLGDRLETVKVSGESEGSEAGEETFGLSLLVSGAEVLRPEIMIGGAVLEHVVDGGEDGGGDGDDRLLGPRRARMRTNWACR